MGLISNNSKISEDDQLAYVILGACGVLLAFILIFYYCCCCLAQDYQDNDIRGKKNSYFESMSFSRSYSRGNRPPPQSAVFRVNEVYSSDENYTGEEDMSLEMNTKGKRALYLIYSLTHHEIT
jgi:hypothetical protein